MLALDGGRPELMSLKDILAAFVDFREEVITRRTVFELGKARERAHILVGLAIAVANIDAVIAADPQGRRIRGRRARALMARAWPAKDVEPLIKLIDEPGRGVVGRHLPAVGGAGPRHPRSAPAAPDRARARQDRRRAARRSSSRSPTISTSSPPAPSCSRSCASELLEIKERVRHAAPHRDPGASSSSRTSRT